MILTVNKNKIFQYISIYLCLLLSGSRFWAITQHRNTTSMYIIEFMVIFTYACCLIYNQKKYRLNFSVLLIILLTFSVVFTRLSVGGVGIEVLLEWTTYISLATIAVLSNVNRFLERFLKVVLFIALISIIGYFFQMFQPSILKAILPQYDSNFSYSVWGDGYTGEIFPYHAWGKFLFSFDEMHRFKNVGIFSEPGCFQIVLNSALFILLFLPNYIGKDIQRRKAWYFCILSIAVVTCQSTTGYIGYFSILLIYLIKRSNGENKIRQRILFVLVVLFLTLAIDFSINGSRSLFYSAIVNKLVADSGGLSVSAGSGVYRMNTIITCISSMLNHPFGVGYDVINASISSTWEDGGAGAILLNTGAALGIPTILVFILWTLYPVFKSTIIKLPEKILFAFLFFNTALAQSEELYVTIIIIPIFLHVVRTRTMFSDEGESMNDLGNYVFRQQL